MKIATVNTIIYSVFWTVCSLLLSMCASIQKPNGGEKDTLPPQLLYSFPSQGQTNVKPQKIELQFNEFFNLKNINSELLISPPLLVEPEISQKGTSLLLEFQSDIEDSTTYSFNFGNAITDFREGNVLKNFSFVFSTGPVLDSLSVFGRVHSCPDKDLPEGLVIGLYQQDSLTHDSTIYINKPNYFSTTNKNGDFSIHHIRAGLYQMVAFEDVNANYMYDGYSEKIGFTTQLVNPEDSLNRLLWLFKEEPPLKQVDVKRDIPMVITYNTALVSEQTSLMPNSNHIAQIIDEKLLLWPLIDENDSSYVFMETNLWKDTLLLKRDSTMRIAPHTLSLASNYIAKNSALRISSSVPIDSVNKTKITIISDSLNIPFTYKKSDFDLDIYTAYKGDKNYTITLEKGAIESIYKQQSDSTGYAVYTKSAESLGALLVNIQGLDGRNYKVELLKDGLVIASKYNYEHLFFSELLPGKYDLRLILDDDNNGRWTAGSYFKRKEAEWVFYNTEQIQLRANWELEIDWNPFTPSKP